MYYKNLFRVIVNFVEIFVCSFFPIASEGNLSNLITRQMSFVSQSYSDEYQNALPYMHGE